MVQAGVDLEVLVVDASLKVLPGLVRFEDAVAGDILFPFSEEDPSFMPDAVQLLKFSKEWIGLAGGAGSGVMNFYSADEGDPVKTPRSKAKSKAKEPSKAAPKRSNPQQVAEHIRQLSLMMPMMQEQLSQIQEEQKRFQEMMDARSTAPPPKASQAPVSMPMQAFAKMMGSPPRAKVASVPLLPVPSTQRGLESRLKVITSGAVGGADSAAAGGQSCLSSAGAEQSPDQLGQPDARCGPPFGLNFIDDGDNFQGIFKAGRSCRRSWRLVREASSLRSFRMHIVG